MSTGIKYDFPFSAKFVTILEVDQLQKTGDEADV